MRHRAAVVLALSAAVSVLPQASSAGSEGSGRLTVFAAASLTDVLPKIDALPRYGFAGSDILALQIQQGAPADVFAAAESSFEQLSSASHRAAANKSQPRHA